MKMFEYMKEHRIILVTGPQRSGTTICARMIELDTGFTYVDEARFRVSDATRALQVALAYIPCVLQGPGLLKDAGIFGQRDDCAVILMQRDIHDITSSISYRDHQKWEQEMSRYTRDISLDRFAETIYGWWWDMVEPLVKHPYYIPYESLSGHPMWVPKEKRVNWRARQWKA